MGAISEPVDPSIRRSSCRIGVAHNRGARSAKRARSWWLAHAAKHGPFVGDTYVSARGVKSVMVLPITRPARCIGVLYFENHLATHAFTPARFGAPAALLRDAISLEDNSQLFDRLTVEISERTRAEQAMRFLAESSRALAESLDYDTVLAKGGAPSPFPLPIGAWWSSPTRTETSGRRRSLM